MSKIICVPYNTRLDKSCEVVDITSHNKSAFSPFNLLAPQGIVENVWQYSKVYPEHLDGSGEIKESWFQWRDEGYKNWRPVRYPMGKGVKPLFTFWNNERLGYIEARKKVYIELYTNAVLSCSKEAFDALVDYWKALQEENIDLYFRDFDGYNRHALNMSLDDVINCPTKIMGHCFVLEKMLNSPVV